MPNLKSSQGFTLIELIVVLAILGTLMGLVVANYAGQRPSRNLRIAQNELVTNIRKVQSYTLSSRNAPNGQSVQYYIVRFDLAFPRQYTIEAMYNIKNPPSGGTASLLDTETIYLPQGIKIKSLAVSAPNPTAAPGCALVAFQLPFSKIITNTSCTSDRTQTPPKVIAGDDYDKIAKYVIDNSSLTADTKTTVTLSDDNNTITNTVTINGITGLVNFQ